MRIYLLTCKQTIMETSLHAIEAEDEDEARQKFERGRQRFEKVLDVQVLSGLLVVKAEWYEKGETD